LKGDIHWNFKVNNWKLEIIPSDFIETVQLLADVTTTVETMKKEMKGTSKDFLEVEN
jgi:hypothetical protein